MQYNKTEKENDEKRKNVECSRSEIKYSRKSDTLAKLPIINKQTHMLSFVCVCGSVQQRSVLLYLHNHHRPNLLPL